MPNTAPTHDWAWNLRDEGYYEFLKTKYQDRAKLATEAEQKRKAAEKAKDTDPHYHRLQVSSEMASLRLDMAYIVDRNNQLEQYVSTLEFLHERVGILEGAYGHTKLMAEIVRADFELLKKTLTKK